MLSPTYEITTALRHTDEWISPPYDIAIVTISYGRVIMSSVWDSMMSKKNVGWPFYAAVNMRQAITGTNADLLAIKNKLRDNFNDNAMIYIQQNAFKIFL